MSRLVAVAISLKTFVVSKARRCPPTKWCRVSRNDASAGRWRWSCTKAGEGSRAARSEDEILTEEMLASSDEGVTESSDVRWSVWVYASTISGSSSSDPREDACGAFWGRVLCGPDRSEGAIWPWAVEAESREDMPVAKKGGSRRGLLKG
ncbi:uncharacterized protein B0H18DRAFT_168293 [Fomitopsis serialis]|uniref:uncharacterized protein n=1 Tax=Fomitopsis serialis TaxID=139415 RepID=UPI002008CC80|nr:uncharacterized protein B0H18DRAFT_168293 [Neoantrodia serialis]KAH9913494.1 hypothetical protein B0H18DRAFT_168293 [Neoantrodia serialis]